MEDLEITQEVRTFLESILDDAGMTDLTPEMKNSMTQELFKLLDARLTTVAVENLSEENLTQFERMLEEKKDKQDVEMFLRDKIHNAPELFAQAMLDFRNSYLGLPKVEASPS